MDRGLQAAGATAKKVISFAWDSNFVCTTNQHKYSLASEIISNYKQPIISNCSFHNSLNLSVVIIGYSLAGMYDEFTVRSVTSIFTIKSKEKQNINNRTFHSDVTRRDTWSSDVTGWQNSQYGSHRRCVYALN